jgi:serine/threonine protein phosphatase PrpC
VGQCSLSRIEKNADNLADFLALCTAGIWEQYGRCVWFALRAADTGLAHEVKNSECNFLGQRYLEHVKSGE